MARTKIPVALRLAPDIKALGERRAKADRRSFASYIEWLVEQDTQKRPPPAGQDREASSQSEPA